MPSPGRPPRPPALTGLVDCPLHGANRVSIGRAPHAQRTEGFAQHSGLELAAPRCWQLLEARQTAERAARCEHKKVHHHARHDAQRPPSASPRAPELCHLQPAPVACQTASPCCASRPAPPICFNC
jgi:hypothetical protein